MHADVIAAAAGKNEELWLVVYYWSARLSLGWPSTEPPVLKLVTSAVVNLNDKDERFVSVSFVSLSSLQQQSLFCCSVMPTC